MGDKYRKMTYKSAVIDKKLEELGDYWGGYSRITPVEKYNGVQALFSILDDLSYNQDEDKYCWTKSIFIRVPIGTVSPHNVFENERENETAETSEYKWYYLTIFESKDNEYRKVELDDTAIAYVKMDCETSDETTTLRESYEIEMLYYIRKGAEEAMTLLRENKYNESANDDVQYDARYGVVKSSTLGDYFPEFRETIRDRIDDDTFLIFKKLSNKTEDIGRIKTFTIHDYLYARSVIYDALGSEVKCRVTAFNEYLNNLSIESRNIPIFDEKTEIVNRDSPEEWDRLYSSNPKFEALDWCVLVELHLYVEHDENGYFFVVSKGDTYNRYDETIKAFIALRNKGLPAIVSGKEKIIACFEETEYIGIVPWRNFWGNSNSQNDFLEQYNVEKIICLNEKQREELKDKIVWMRIKCSLKEELW